MNDLEAARYIEEALVNLPEDYPNGDEVHKAYGRLIVGHLGLKPMKGHTLHLPCKGSKWVLIRRAR